MIIVLSKSIFGIFIIVTKVIKESKSIGSRKCNKVNKKSLKNTELFVFYMK